MDQITITVPDPKTKAYLDRILSSGDYSSASAYVLALIDQDRKRRNQARLEELLLEGLEGEPIELTDAEFDKMRREYDDRHPESGAR